MLKQSRKLKHVLVLYNKTGIINTKLFGKHVLPFWFKNQEDHYRFLVTCDGASGHNYHKARKIAREIYNENENLCNIPT